MSTIRIRSEFIRIAHAFSRAGGHNGPVPNLNGGVIDSIYVEPHPCGKGVQIISTDGGALCVQYDAEGYIDSPRLICGVDRDSAIDMRGSTINDRWLVGTLTATPGNLAVYRDRDGKNRVAKTPDVTTCRVRMHGEHGDAGLSVYPNVRKHIPTPEQVAGMQFGFPYVINAGYLSIIARLYDDNFVNARSVNIVHDPSGEFGRVNDTDKKAAVLTFPWRDNLYVVIAPMGLSEDKTAAGCAEVVRNVTVGEVDPAEGL